MRLLPAATPMLSKVADDGVEPAQVVGGDDASQMNSVTRFSQCCIHDLLPRLAVNSSTTTRTTT